MFCVVGLGNTADRYSACRHNVGFMALDYLSAQLQAPFDRRIRTGMLAETRVDGEKLLLVKPLTSINHSGACISELVGSLGIPMKRLAVIVDDIDLPPGEIRIRDGGSAGTHNGMRSIVRILGSGNFPRIRIGVGKPHDAADLTAYVLDLPSEQEKEDLNRAFSFCLDAVLLMMKGKTNEAQNRYNVKARTRKKNRVSSDLFFDPPCKSNGDMIQSICETAISQNDPLTE